MLDVCVRLDGIRIDENVAAAANCASDLFQRASNVFIHRHGIGDALGLGKTLSVVLFDRDDFESCLQDGCTFTEVLAKKLRAAAEEGLVYFPFRSREIQTSRVVLADGTSKSEADLHNVPTDDALSKDLVDLVIICEGANDEIVLSYLAVKICKESGIERRVTIIPALGKRTIPRLANKLPIALKSKLVFVADSDGDVEQSRSLLLKDLESADPHLIVVHPTLEAWLFPDQEDPKAYLLTLSRTKRVPPAEIIRARLEAIDIDRLRLTSATFNEFLEIVKR